MMAKTETLTCIECGSQWEREMRGGGKPGFCSDACRKERRRRSSTKWRVKNRAYHKQYYEQNKERLYRENRKRAEASPEKQRQYNQEYRAKNRDRLKVKDGEYYEKNKERITARNEEYREEHSDWYREYYKEYYLKNQEEIKAWSKGYYLANREQKLEYQRKYSSENPEVAEAARLRYETRKLRAWKEDVFKDVLLERDGWTCHICKGEIPKGLDRYHPLFPHIEHIVPLSKGGEHSYENTAPAHASCNIQKGDKLDGWQNIKPYVPEEVNRERVCS